ncbi:hypothetical protein [Ornithinimicrobium kibberense]|uniref:hypothetical protein n=1 Tax=Ornithinimicrobium kibberense TaxID=282060 RepID=UPI0036139224
MQPHPELAGHRARHRLGQEPRGRLRRDLGDLRPALRLRLRGRLPLPLLGGLAVRGLLRGPLGGRGLLRRRLGPPPGLCGSLLVGAALRVGLGLALPFGLALGSPLAGPLVGRLLGRRFLRRLPPGLLLGSLAQRLLLGLPCGLGLGLAAGRLLGGLALGLGDPLHLGLLVGLEPVPGLGQVGQLGGQVVGAPLLLRQLGGHAGLLLLQGGLLPGLSCLELFQLGPHGVGLGASLLLGDDHGLGPGEQVGDVVAHPGEPVLLDHVLGLLVGQRPDLLVLHPEHGAGHRHLVDRVRLPGEELERGGERPHTTLLVALPGDRPHRLPALRLLRLVGVEALPDLLLVHPGQPQLGLDAPGLRLRVGQVGLGLGQRHAGRLHLLGGPVEPFAGGHELLARVVQLLVELGDLRAGALLRLALALLLRLDPLDPVTDLVEVVGEGGAGDHHAGQRQGEDPADPGGCIPTASPDRGLVDRTAHRASPRAVHGLRPARAGAGPTTR